MVNRSLIALAALPALAAAGCFLLPPDDEPGVDASVVDQPGYVCNHVGDFCKGGRCIDISGKIACYPECTTLGDACEVGACYYSATTGGFVCLSPGAKSPGEACGATGDCVMGAQCLDAGGGLVCWLGCNNVYDCPAPSECVDTELGFTVCVETVE